MNPSQKTLPFDEAEGSYAERRNMLGLALIRVGCDCHLSVLMQWVFNATGGGEGELIKSYKELSAAPWGLCCGVTKVRATVARARQLGLIEAAETCFVSGAQRANRYRIDWQGVRRALDLKKIPRVETTPPVDASATRQGPVAWRQGPVVIRHPYKGINSLCTSTLIPDPVPEAGAGPGPESCEQKGGFDRAVMEDVPELAEALGRTVDPLPARSLVYGAFAKCDGKFLDAPLTVVEWFRRQLELRRPVCGPTEAELLLVLSAALRAAKMPGREVQTTRAAVFVGVVAHRRWRRALPHVPEARRQLDQMLSMFGDGLLRCPTWPPARQQDAAAAGPTQGGVTP